jgi:hypothetical protein
VSRGPAILLAVVAVLATTAGLILAAETRRAPDSDDGRVQFREFIGGPGGGATVDATRCVYGFDPRLESDCLQDLGPVPAAKPFCVCHGCSLGP